MATRREDAEYESDPEDAPLPSMRRREASDDEDGMASDGGGKPVRKDPRAGIGSDGESDGQGGAQVYDDEADEEEDEMEEYYDEEEEYGEMDEELEMEDEVVEEGGHRAASVKEEGIKDVRQSLEYEGQGDGDRRSSGNAMEHPDENQVEDEEEKKKENEPYAVPTAGAFYMHDDRFQDNGRGRRRRMFGGRKLWDPKDERAWVHDRFEEMNLQDAQYDEERMRSRGRFRGRGGGKSRGASRGYGRGSRHRDYSDVVNSQNRTSRTVRGRGPRRYEALPKNNRDIPASRQKQSPAKPQEPTTSASTRKQSSQTANVELDPVVPQKHSFASSLNSASPPFYPSGSSNSNQDILLMQKRDAQAGIINDSLSYSMHTEENSQSSQSSTLLRGKTVVDSVGHDRLYMSDSHRSVVGKTLASVHLQPSGFYPSPDNADISSSSRVQGTGINTAGPPNNQSASAVNHVGRVSAHTQAPNVQPSPAQTSFQPAVRVPAQQFIHRSVSGNQTSSSSPPPAGNSSEVGDVDSPPGSGKSRTSVVGKGKINNQGTGRSSFIYSGGQVLGATGAMGLAHGDQNFRTPALLPVMQFGGQHPSGLGVPAVGMALPGYVAQPQLGFGNSEMTWVPVLAGMPGALGASYCPPYLALDGNYYRPSGQNSSSASSKETTTSKPGTHMSQSDPVIDEAGRRQNKPRSRYSEMNFGQ
ncbi:protein MLN51 homolog isoform X1 [Musa acuminata AAA Group]|uniref:protein MLN51 homolog isoform X1 n=1 Tax=Musa acuminata AAA Group TaxID=214697 RepID=UPI0031D0EF88